MLKLDDASAPPSAGIESHGPPRDAWGHAAMVRRILMRPTRYPLSDAETEDLGGPLNAADQRSWAAVFEATVDLGILELTSSDGDAAAMVGGDRRRRGVARCWIWVGNLPTACWMLIEFGDAAVKAVDDEEEDDVSSPNFSALVYILMQSRKIWGHDLAVDFLNGSDQPFAARRWWIWDPCFVVGGLDDMNRPSGTSPVVVLAVDGEAAAAVVGGD
ncbi:hypothetical protein ACLOJK_040613 [Asimina triloba]